MVMLVIGMPAFAGIPFKLCPASFSTGSRTDSRTLIAHKRPHIVFSRGNRYTPRAQLSNRQQQASKVDSSPGKWESIRSGDFEQLMAERRLPLCFIGMSNCGKSYWTNALVAERDFGHLCVDDEIERALEPELTELGYSGIADMAKWMGYPADERFARNEARYLELEENITRNISITKEKKRNFVLDTTGSVVYLSKNTQNELRKEFFIVHLAADEDVLERMREAYFESPKPVVWGDSYSQNDDESSDQALRRCYEGLLRERLKRYEKLAHVSIPAKFAFSLDATVDDLFQLVKSTLDRDRMVPH